MNVNTLVPILTRIECKEATLVPDVLKHAVVTPLLKKNGLDPEKLTNYSRTPDVKVELHIEATREIHFYPSAATHGHEWFIWRFPKRLTPCARLRDSDCLYTGHYTAISWSITALTKSLLCRGETGYGCHTFYVTDVFRNIVIIADIRLLLCLNIVSCAHINMQFVIFTS